MAPKSQTKSLHFNARLRNHVDVPSKLGGPSQRSQPRATPRGDDLAKREAALAPERERRLGDAARLAAALEHGRHLGAHVGERA